MDATGYFKTARERYAIKLRREAGDPLPWTTDEVFQRFRFCHVHREDDKTTQWFRDNVRGPLAAQGNKRKLVESTLIFRWFNRIETGEAIKDLLLHDWSTEEARFRLEDLHPVVTGAYMIRSEPGLSKLDGVLYQVDQALPKLPALVDTWGSSIQQATHDLSANVDSMGPFLAYEITTDLRWTPVLSEAMDIQTWANPGPGCAKGLGRLFGDEWKWNRGRAEHQAEMNVVMRNLVSMSRRAENWPNEWPQWEMRTAEHWACEYDKHCRGVANERLKRRFPGGV